MCLAANALDRAGVGRQDPIRYEGLMERYVPDCKFRGRQNRKIKFACWQARRCAAAWNQTCSAR